MCPQDRMWERMILRGSTSRPDTRMQLWHLQDSNCLEDTRCSMCHLASIQDLSGTQKMMQIVLVLYRREKSRTKTHLKLFY